MTRIYLQQKMATNVVIILAIIALLSLFSLFFAIRNDGFSNESNLWGLVAAIVVIAWPMTAYLVYADKGYRISYDDEAVYHRPHGLTLKLGYPVEQMLRYEDIDVVFGDPGRMINFGIMPFEFVRLYRKDWDGEELFMISPFFLHHAEMKELIECIYKKCPDSFAQDVIDYLNSDQIL